jgi:ferric-dicitrate binding protein FerR (iron transport regulator)
MKGLIDKFYNGTCTPEEAKLVMDFLLNEEEEKEWEEILLNENEEKEWEGIPSTANPYEAEMLTVIKSRTFGKVRRLPWLKIAVAASILLLCSLSLMRKETTPGNKTTGWVSFNAPADKRMSIKLTDGSKILLEPTASLRYDSVSYSRSRTLYLEGKALFTVSASTEKPFTVNANGSSVIALGTSFLVSPEKVTLFSGKVLIRKAGAKDQYLRPGEEMVYNIKKSVAIPVPERVKHKSINVSNDSIVFDNVPLKEVFNLFRERYHITIQCDERKINEVYFTGKVLASDPIALILSTITRINNLTLSKEDDIYIIR